MVGGDPAPGKVRFLESEHLEGLRMTVPHVQWPPLDEQPQDAVTRLLQIPAAETRRGIR